MYIVHPHTHLKNRSEPVSNRFWDFSWAEGPRTDVDLRALNRDRKSDQTGYSPVWSSVLFQSAEPDLKALVTFKFFAHSAPEKMCRRWWNLITQKPKKSCLTHCPWNILVCWKLMSMYRSSCLCVHVVSCISSHTIRHFFVPFFFLWVLTVVISYNNACC